MTQNNLHQDSRKVVSIHRFSCGRTMSPIRQAEAYWSALKSGADVPFRSQIDPRGLENMLAFTFVLERLAPGVARFRLAGQHLSDLAGADLRGMPLTVFFSPDARPLVAAVLQQVFDGPGVAELALADSGRRSSQPGEARMILLPLRSASGETNRALGVLVAETSQANSPRRFDISATATRTVGSPRPDDRAAQARPIGAAASHLRLVR
jgi:hypothetical protein